MFDRRSRFIASDEVDRLDAAISALPLAQRLRLRALGLARLTPPGRFFFALACLASLAMALAPGPDPVPGKAPGPALGGWEIFGICALSAVLVALSSGLGAAFAYMFDDMTDERWKERAARPASLAKAGACVAIWVGASCAFVPRGGPWVASMFCCGFGSAILWILAERLPMLLRWLARASARALRSGLGLASARPVAAARESWRSLMRSAALEVADPSDIPELERRAIEASAKRTSARSKPARL